MPELPEEFAQELFRPLGDGRAQAEIIVRPSETYWQNAWRRLRENRLAMAGLAVILVLMLLAIVGPWLSPFSYSDQILTLKNKPPGYSFYLQIAASGADAGKISQFSEQPMVAAAGFRLEKRTFWFGSDALGRDLFTRNWYGARISLTIGLVTALLVFLIGIVYGGISGYVGGWTDEIMMRVVEILSAVPFLLYVILLMVLMEPGLKTIFIALGAVYWLPLARSVRGQILALKEQEYVIAARALGAGVRPHPLPAFDPQYHGLDHRLCHPGHPRRDFHRSLAELSWPGRGCAHRQLGRPGQRWDPGHPLLSLAALFSRLLYQPDDAGIQRFWRRPGRCPGSAPEKIGGMDFAPSIGSRSPAGFIFYPYR